MRAEDFASFYEEIHQQRPFPWQRDLVARILERRSWPRLVDVPTGLGKTAMLDIAVFIAALDATTVYTERVARRRIFFVVDRRIVVDQAEIRARLIAARLRDAAPGGVLAEVVERLRVPDLCTRTGSASGGQDAGRRDLGCRLAATALICRAS